ncbi:MAG: hypothetical protein JWO40_363 [Candidatus Doudnabacteria bacterium]|nr:hypothetical protein [Candidatus Doudnabacteria bacterium]
MIIKRPNALEFEQALSYIQEVYQRKFQTKPKDIWPDCLIGLDSNGQIIGLLAMQFSEGSKFEIENMFQFDLSILRSARIDIVSFGRWSAKTPGLGTALMFGAVKYSLERDRTIMLSCSKPNILKFLRSNYGLAFDILGVPRVSANIDLEDQAYFSEKPYPVLCAAHLEQWYYKLKQLIPSSLTIKF